MTNKFTPIFIAGHNGLVGSSIYRKFKLLGYKNLITINKSKLDLLDQSQVYKFLKLKKPKVVIIAAAKVGGIYANNKYRAQFIYENISIQNNLIHGSFINGIKNIIFFGSSCIYPKKIKQPLKEEYLLSNYLEKTNEPYAIAKIAGIKMCESYNYQYNTNYKCLIPANSYGPNDSYEIYNSHFFPALIRKVHEAKIKKKSKILLWGSGNPRRELIYVDDIADASIFFLKNKIKETIVNIGTGYDMKIKDYAKYIIKRMNLNIDIILDKNKPDGISRKLLDISLAKKYGWVAKTTLKTGFLLTYNDFLLRFNKDIKS